MKQLPKEQRLSYIQKHSNIRTALFNKFTKKYGKKYDGVISQEIDQFIDNSVLNDETLLQLDQKIDSAVLNTIQSIKPGTSSSQRSQLSTSQGSRSTILRPFSSQNSTTPYLSVPNGVWDEYPNYHLLHQKPEEYEWDQLQKLKAMNYRSNIQNVEENQLKNKTIVNSVIKQQMKERKLNEIEEKNQLEEWRKSEKIKFELWKKEEEEKKKEEHDIVMQLKKDRETQLQEKLRYKNKQIEEDKLADKLYMEKINLEIQDQIKKEEENKANIKKFSRDLQLYNLENEKMKLSQFNKEKEEDKRLIDEAIKLDQMKEMMKQKELQKRFDKIESRVKMISSNKIFHDYETKRLQEEANQQKYLEQANNFNDLDEQMRLQKVKENRLRGKVLLEAQLSEREARKEKEKQEKEMYRKLFNKEAELALEKERQKELNRMKVRADYSMDLQRQISEKKENLDHMTKDIRLMNRRLLGAAIIGSSELPFGYHPI